MNKNAFVNAISNLRPSSTFLSLVDYCNSQEEVADYSIVFHVSYQHLLERSIEQLESYQPLDDLEKEAKLSLLDSYRRSLQKVKESPIEEREDGYRHFQDSEGGWIKGVKLHEETETLHLYGKIVHKTVKKGGSKKEVKSSPLTLAKQKLSRDLPVSKWRQFKLTPNQVGKITVEHMSLEAPND